MLISLWMCGDYDQSSSPILRFSNFQFPIFSQVLGSQQVLVYFFKYLRYTGKGKGGEYKFTEITLHDNNGQLLSVNNSLTHSTVCLSCFRTSLKHTVG